MEPSSVYQVVVSFDLFSHFLEGFLGGKGLVNGCALYDVAVKGTDLDVALIGEPDKVVG